MKCVYKFCQVQHNMVKELVLSNLLAVYYSYVECFRCLYNSLCTSPVIQIKVLILSRLF